MTDYVSGQTLELLFVLSGMVIVGTYILAVAAYILFKKFLEKIL